MYGYEIWFATLKFYSPFHVYINVLARACIHDLSHDFNLPLGYLVQEVK